jgi:hypothetical protein
LIIGDRGGGRQYRGGFAQKKWREFGAELRYPMSANTR